MDSRLQPEHASGQETEMAVAKPALAGGLFTEEQVCVLVRMPLKMLREVSRLANLGVDVAGHRFYHRAEVEILRGLLESSDRAWVEEIT